MLLHLRVLLDLQSSPTVLPLSLSHHVETGRPHQKYIVTRTRVSRSKSPDQQTPFGVVLAPAIHFWCRRGESNSRPQCLHYEGITTILYYYNSFIKSKQRQSVQELRLQQNHNLHPCCLLVRPTMHFDQNAKSN
jgi:hypothetical protein